MARHKLKKITTHARNRHGHLTSAALITMTVEQQQIMLHLIKACPSYRRPMERFKRRTHTQLVYVLLGEFARHLLKLQKNSDTSEFPAVADAIELLYLRGSDYVKTAITGGLLEMIQLHWRIDNIDPEQFAQYLKPVGKRFWNYIKQYHYE